jgi:hypothetical protein
LSENELNNRATANISLFLSHVVGELALPILTLKVIFLPTNKNKNKKNKIVK